MNQAFQANAFQTDSFQQFALSLAHAITTKFIANMGTFMGRCGG